MIHSSHLLHKIFLINNRFCKSKKRFKNLHYKNNVWKQIDMIKSECNKLKVNCNIFKLLHVNVIKYDIWIYLLKNDEN